MSSHIFYHSADLDGHCSGAIVRMYCEREYYECPVMHPIDYGEPFPWDELLYSDAVWMVDWTLQPSSEFERLQAKGLILWILDHHKTSLELVGKVSFAGRINPSKSACELCHEYCLIRHGGEVVDLLGRYDTWKQGDDWETDVLPFQYGMRSLPTDPATDEGFATWRSWFDPRCEATATIEMVKEWGRRILEYQRKLDAKGMTRAFPLAFEGLRAIASIGSSGSSQSFASVWDGNKYDLMLSVHNVRNEFWTVSLYTDKDIDLSEIAKRRGGGGHTKAAGFQIQHLSEIGV